LEGFCLAKKKCVPSFEKPDVPQESKRKYTEKIVKYRKDLFNREKKLVFCEGLPHTGKTLNAIEAGVEQVMKGIYSKLVIIRPITDNEIGFLPGTAEDKMAFLMR
jgi:predicted ribonuclease YlaK